MSKVEFSSLEDNKMPSPSRVESAQVHWVESGASKEHEGEREEGRRTGHDLTIDSANVSDICRGNDQVR